MNIIIDYGLGNIRSVKNWLQKGGINTVVSRDGELIKNADLLILPGVGAYRDAMAALKIYELDEMIFEHVKKNKPIIGICLGMQLLYEYSFEGGCYEGLGLLKGEIVSFDKFKNIKIPHMGWNELNIRNGSKYFGNLKDKSFVYYVHSFYAKAASDEVVATTNYDEDIVGIVQSNNILGFQFHPEKSGEVGMEILKGVKEFINDYISSN